MTNFFDERLPERFWDKCIPEPMSGCWLWLGGEAGQRPNGYGAVWAGGKLQRAHRFAYERLAGPIPHGLDLDHLCRVRMCVNPDHLEPVTRRENMRRSPLRGRAHNPSACPHGHAYDIQNTYVHPRGYKACRACARARHFARQRKKAG